MRFLYLATLVIVSHLSYAQSFENVKAVAQSDKVIIYYDLIASNQEQTFAVQIFGSHDNFSHPIKFVTGDIGTSVRPGVNKRVEWSVEAELKTFKGDITFELRGLPNALKLSFRTPAPGKSLKKGKKTDVQWLGGTPSQQVRINLYQGEKMIAPVTETSNTGKVTWVVPKDVKKGSDYYLKMTSGSESVNSGTFRIKSRTPFIVKALPVLLVAGAAYFVLGQKKPEPVGPPDEAEPLPGPPNPE
jgi:hypothetical protein